MEEKCAEVYGNRLRSEMKIKLVLTFLGIILWSSINAQNQHLQFWNTLKKYCNTAFEGEIQGASVSDTAFAGKKLVMHVSSCEENTIKIPFFVGNDSSRTWVLTLLEDGILLKHDHRHEDGTPDQITMYGGKTSNNGSANRQIFPADQETANLLPAAIGNVWWIDVFYDDYFSYNLRRVNTDRVFTVKFNLKNSISPLPGKPWGWKD